MTDIGQKPRTVKDVGLSIVRRYTYVLHSEGGSDGDSVSVLANYSSAKAGVIGFTRALALESARKGITVNGDRAGLHQD